MRQTLEFCIAIFQKNIWCVRSSNLHFPCTVSESFCSLLFKRNTLYDLRTPKTLPKWILRSRALIGYGQGAIEFGKQCHVLPYSTMDPRGLPRFSLLYLENGSVLENSHTDKICSPESALASDIIFIDCLPVFKRDKSTQRITLLSCITLSIRRCPSLPYISTMTRLTKYHFLTRFIV
jgi:hypothetical protein